MKGKGAWLVGWQVVAQEHTENIEFTVFQAVVQLNSRMFSVNGFTAYTHSSLESNVYY